ncbi:S-layer homology domain-containing protein [Proteiniborus sp. MB09-C3]|uniref:S-layer homology domain-containing protein n=1 Tax=Proteiniborus sp. MB09-C3 TaxID=3050072 RepID=UPI002554068A|nr:S-layer homology domain-containing protein [Proteiniborus sp. MB09-C3]WIV11012.1 S-layer homology domain-containing protein [Proteiniborus sp. MB09-C3]
MNKVLKQLGVLAVIFIMMVSLFPVTSFSAASDEGYDDGYSEGWLEGIEEAEYDMAKGNSKNYSNAMPSNDEIIKTYKLNIESTRYKNAFLDGFKDGFKNGYNRIYSSPDDDKNKDKNKEMSHAEDLGFVMGEAFGYRDYYDEKSNRWSRAVPSSSDIIEIFDLKKETNAYRTDFLNAFKAKFQEGYEEGYRKAKFEPFEDSFEQGKDDGEYFGGLLGDMYGKKDYYLSNPNNWKRNLPSRAKIISSFYLDKDSNEYEDAFIESFIYSFEEKYNDSYRNANANINKITYESGYEQGKAIGLERGEGFANMDIMLGQSNNILRHISSEYEVVNGFKLYLESDKYTEGFISGYNEGLNEGYVKSFQDLNYSNSSTKFETQNIPISGGEIATKDKRISIKINRGTYYNDVAVSINGLPELYNRYLPSKDKFIKASEVYSIEVANPSYQFDNKKFIELSFEYYGSQNGGIYKYINNTWVYLPSKITENRITTYIKPYSLNTANGIYAVFLDEDFKNIKDIRGHWAKDEIITFARREIAGLFGDNTYRPDSPITRGQLLRLLSKMYEWNLNGLDENIKELEKLNDYQNLGDYKLLIAYGIKHSYMGLYPDNTFKVNNHVTYNQINYIIRKVIGDNSFNWINIASSMMRDKDVRSKSYSSMDNTITRAEAIYMLYLLNEQKY